MKRCGADNSVECVVKRQVQEVTRDQDHARAELRGEMLARGVQHVLREIDANYFSARESFEQFSRESSSSTSCIEHDFVAS